MYYFCVDIGNTRAKWALFREDDLLWVKAADYLDSNTARQIRQQYPEARCILSATTSPDESLLQELRSFSTFILLSPDIRLPFRNEYATPDTLGLDRIALAAAGACSFPGEDVLIIDAGTCITLDFVDRNACYLGGSIHPGLHMRIKAMHQFTGKLPMVPVEIPQQILGNSTSGCMQSGGIMGAALEIDAMIQLYRSVYPGCKVVLTGGDAAVFFSLLKNEIFALPNFVLTGLLKIAQHNV